MAYTNSPLVSYTKISPNKSVNRKHAIDTVTIHCVVGQVTVERLGEIFANPSRKASSNYGVGKDGRIGLYVEEKDRSWCSGGTKNGVPIRVNGISGADNDQRAITIEVASDTTAPYAITAEAMEGLIKLLVDICQRNNIKQLLWKGDKKLVGKVDQQNMTVHRWFAQKSCPGDFLYNLHGKIAEEVNRRLGTVTPTPAPAPTPTPEPAPKTDATGKYKVTIPNLRIRKGPGTNYAANGYTGVGTFTVTEVSAGQGSTKGWGKLKSGAGWFSLDFATKIG